MVVLVEEERSAAPCTSSGTAAAKAFRAVPPEARVAIDSPGVKVGAADSQPAGRRPAVTRSNSAASAGWASA